MPTNPYGSHPQIDPDAGYLRELLQAVRRHLMVIAGSTVLGVAVVFLITINMTKLYTATALILIENRVNNVVNFEAVVSGLPSDSATIDSQVMIIESQTLASQIVDDLNLMDDPEFNSTLDDGNADLPIWHDAVAGLRASFQPDPERLSDEALAERTRITVLNAVVDRMHVQRQALTYVIEVSFASESPEKAAMIANAVADLYIEDQLDSRIEVTQRATEWLDTRLQSLREEVRQAETEATAFANQNNLISAGGTTITEQQLSEISQQLIAVRAERASTEASYNRVRRLVASGGDIQSIPQVVQSPSILQLRNDQTQLRREEAELLGRYLVDHPDVISIREQMREVEEQLNSEMNRILNGLGNEVEVARDREQSLEAALESITIEQAENNEATIQLRELERNARSQRILYETFLARFNETLQQEDLQTADARVIDEAQRPLLPSHPKTVFNLALGGVLGLFGGLSLVFMGEWLDQGLRTRLDVESFLGIPQIAAIPFLTKKDRVFKRKRYPPEAIVSVKPQSAYSSAVQALRASIDLSNVDSPPKVILVTSALPNEGKTTVALSLGRLAAMSGQRTLLIDADLRHPTLQKLIIPRKRGIKAGLVNVLAHSDKLVSVVAKDSLTKNLYLMFAGKRAANPTQLLSSDRMRKLINDARAFADVVIIDAAPILPVVDSRVLARLADTTVFVVKWQETPKGAAREAVRHLVDFDAPIAGIVLSQVDIKQQTLYGSEGSYKYYENYKDYYSK